MATAKSKPKLKLYKVLRFYAVPATVYVVAPNKRDAELMVEAKEGPCPKVIVKTFKYDRPRILRF